MNGRGPLKNLPKNWQEFPPFGLDATALGMQHPELGDFYLRKARDFLAQIVNATKCMNLSADKEEFVLWAAIASAQRRALTGEDCTVDDVLSEIKHKLGDYAAVHDKAVELGVIDGS